MTAATTLGLFIVGAGGLGRETLDVAETRDIPVQGFLDDALARGRVRALPVHPVDAIPRQARYVIGIADGHARQRLSRQLDSLGARPLTLTHPRATIASGTMVAEGCLVLANAYVSSSVTLSAHVQVHYNATVGHDTVVEAFTAILPGANVSGNVCLGERVIIGANACVLPGRRVGDGAIVGAGAVVTADVPDGAIVVGVPARPLR